MTRSLAESLGGGTAEQWALDFLTAAGFPGTPENVRAVVSWEYAESGAGGGMWNPLNTTQGGYPDETNANSVGVKNYARRADGIAANAKVIHNGYYPAVVAAFQHGDNAHAVVDAIIRSPWGTRHINLIGVDPTPHSTPKDEPMRFLYPAATSGTTFRGAIVDTTARTMVAEGDAIITPALDPLELSATAWDSFAVPADTLGHRRFAIKIPAAAGRGDVYVHTVT